MRKGLVGTFALVGLIAFVPMRVRADATSEPSKKVVAASLSGLDFQAGATLSV
jgi:hypothetical protein